LLSIQLIQFYNSKPLAFQGFLVIGKNAQTSLLSNCKRETGSHLLVSFHDSRLTAFPALLRRIRLSGEGKKIFLSMRLVLIPFYPQIEFLPIIASLIYLPTHPIHLHVS